MTRSLSNLYKAQVNQNKGEAYTRVIDHNELLEQKLTALSFERMAELRRQKLAGNQQNGEGASDGEAPEGAAGGQPAGFTEGITGMAMSVSPELEIDYVERAKEEADQIVSKATADAETILRKAAQEAEKLKENARQQGEEQGYAAGMEHAQAQEAQMRQQLQQIKEQQEQDYAARLHTMEPEVMDAVIHVFDQVMHTGLVEHRSVLLHLIRRTVQHIKNSREFRIFVSAEDYASVSDRKQEIFEKIGGEAVLDIIMDESMQPGQCTIDTDEGIFECGIEIQLSNLVKDLQALSGVN